MPGLDGFDSGYGIADPPARSIARLRCRYGSVATETTRPGTCFLYARRNGRCYLATAGHLIFNHARRLYPSSLEINLSRADGSLCSIRIEADVRSRVFVPPAFVEGPGDGDPESDIGLIRIDDDLPGWNRIPASSADPPGGKAVLIGYPATQLGQSTSPYHRTMNLVAVAGQADNWTYAGDPATTVGFSGAPLIADDGDKGPTVYGIHLHGGTRQRAVRLTAPIRQQLRAWINEGQGTP